MTNTLDRISVSPDYELPTILGVYEDEEEGEVEYDESETEVYAPEGMNLRESSYGVIPAQ